jgi:hypothetical protein
VVADRGHHHTVGADRTGTNKTLSDRRLKCRLNNHPQLANSELRWQMSRVSSPALDLTAARRHWVDIAMATTLVHKSGEWIRGRLRIGTEGQNRGTNANQALGSSITYMRRYGLAAMLGMTVEEDDDGAASGYNSRTAKPAKNEVENAIHQQKQPAATSGVLDKLADAKSVSRSSMGKERLIRRIIDGEEYLATQHDRSDSEAMNSREKHLRTKVLEKASIDDLTKFLSHIGAKAKGANNTAAKAVGAALDGDIVTAVN